MRLDRLKNLSKVIKKAGTYLCLLLTFVGICVSSSTNNFIITQNKIINKREIDGNRKVKYWIC